MKKRGWRARLGPEKIPRLGSDLLSVPSFVMISVMGYSLVGYSVVDVKVWEILDAAEAYMVAKMKTGQARFRLSCLYVVAFFRSILGRDIHHDHDLSFGGG